MLPHRNLLRVPLAILAIGLLPARILAQSTTATCLSTFNWMSNSKNQSPCLVAAYLQGACNGGQFSVPSLPANAHYNGPYADQQNPCQCSSVTYNAVSACGLCQNHTIVTWDIWDTNCSTVYLNVFPPGVPQGTTIPQWAFQDMTILPRSFNVTLAQLAGDNPESTPSAAQSTGSSTSATAPAVSASSGSKSHTGSIAGGVIGGAVGVALIAGVVVFFVMRHKRSRVSRSAEFATGQTVPLTSTGYTDTAPFRSEVTQPSLYDPADPRTFPASRQSNMPRTGPHVTSSTYYSNSSMRSASTGLYRGVPEI